MELLPAPVIAVVGATATGKSDLALHLAQVLSGEIVNADAMQLYRGMDIGTAKLPLGQRRGLPHHQLDLLDVCQEASVEAYQRHARRDLASIAAAGRRPVLVGGSGLYVRAVLDRLEIPPTDPTVRAELEAELAADGAPALHRRLAEADRRAAAAIPPGNGRRLVRALEVIRLTGRPFSATLPRGDYLVPTVQLGLRLDRQVLDRRIAERVERMWQQGLVEEVRALQAAGLGQGRTASRALGYAQVLAMLARTCSQVEAKAGTVQLTRRLARRQESWFGRDARIVWLPADAPDLVDRALSAVSDLDPTTVPAAPAVHRGARSAGAPPGRG